MNIALAVSPYALRSVAERQQRLERLQEAHIRPLTGLVHTIREERGPAYHVPYFDPLDGGVGAAALFLLEAPGPKAVATGFVSRDNPDQSAKNMAEMLAEAGLQRSQTVLWNIVPWYVGDGRKIRPVQRADLEAARPDLIRLLGLLPKLRAVVLVGRKAQAAGEHVRRLVDVPVFNTYHPSPQVLNITPARRQEIVAVFRSVAMSITSRTATGLAAIEQ